MAGTQSKLTDEIRAACSGKMNVEIAAMVAKGDLTADQAGEFLLDRATAKAKRKGLIEAPTA